MERTDDRPVWARVAAVLMAIGLIAAIAAVGLSYALDRDDRDAEAAAQGRPPVVLLMFDEFPADLLLGPDGGIDAGRYPAFAELARAGYWFPNATTTYDSTIKAIPEIVTGQLPRRDAEATYASHPRSLYDLFGHMGYAIQRVEAATTICPPRWCRGATPRRPSALPLLQGGRREALARFLGSIRPTERPTFWLGHILLPHGPYMFLPSGKQTRAGWQDPLPGLNRVPGFHSPYLALHSQQRLQLQIGFVDRELGRLFARMRREGTFDRSLIVVTADHGVSSEWGVTDKREASMSNIDEVAPVPLLVKAPRQKRGKTVRSYVRTTDVAPTIADLLGTRLPYRADGRSAFSRTVGARRTVTMIKRDFSGRLRISAPALERRRATLLRARLRHFGHGDWDSLYTGIGPGRELIGRIASDRPRAPRSAVRARIAAATARALRAVDRRSPVLPTHIVGTIQGGRPGVTRAIAVAIDGRIETTGETFHLRPEGGGPPGPESFATMVPERAIRPGRNRVEIFEILDGGSLRPLGGT